MKKKYLKNHAKSQRRYTKTLKGRIAKRIQNRRWRKKHKIHVSRYNKSWRKKHPNYWKIYRLKSKRQK